MDVFFALAHFYVKERVSLSSVQCELSPRQFYSLSFHSVERQRRFSIVLRYTNNYHHPYIDSTTVLSDIYEHEAIQKPISENNIGAPKIHTVHSQKRFMHVCTLYLALVVCPQPQPRYARSRSYGIYRPVAIAMVHPQPQLWYIQACSHSYGTPVAIAMVHPQLQLWYTRSRSYGTPVAVAMVRPQSQIWCACSCSYIINAIVCP